MLRSRVRRFTLTAPFSLLGAGLLLAAQGGTLLESNWGPQTLAMTHMGTLGFLSLALMGIVYSRVASFAGAQVPAHRGADVVYALMLIGVATLVGGLLSGQVWPLFVSLSALGVAIPVFAVTVLRALRGARGAASVAALRMALWSLLISAAIGIWMLHGHAGMLFPGPRPLWLQVHLSVALLGWFGGLFAALSGSGPTRAELRLLTLGVVLPPAVLLMDTIQGSAFPAPQLAAGAALPAALAVWGIRPVRALRAAPAGPDAGIELRRAGFALAPGVAIAALIVVGRDGPDWNLLLGWLAIWGWAGLVVHGLLLRDAGLGSRLPSVGFGLHLSALAAGLIATVSGVDWIARLAGLLLVATAACLFAALRRAQK